ncbi:MAG: hypothetical protein AAF539_13145 [Planctomycetota bacterium]
MLAGVKIHGENIGRSLRKRYADASGVSWEETGQTFHLQYRPKRFTHKHARQAGYGKRKPRYNRVKLRRFGHTYPLVFSGEVRRLTQSARIIARKGTGRIGNQGGVRVTYRGARKLNFRHPDSNINMVREFTTVTDQEAITLGQYWQARFQPRFSK